VDKSTLRGNIMKKIDVICIGIVFIALLSGCSDKKKSKSLTESGMTCGAGKCGANAANGSALLVKKKMNILDQMKKDDNRRDCVLKAKTTKALYACVRVSETGRLSAKCSTKNTKSKVVPKKKVSSKVKCESGKCSSDMQKN